MTTTDTRARAHDTTIGPDTMSSAVEHTTNGHSSNGIASPSEVDQEAPNSNKPDLATSKGLIRYALDRHRWKWRGQELVGVDLVDGTERPLRGSRARGRVGTIHEWLIRARITKGDGKPPAGKTMTEILGAIEAVAGPDAEVEAAPELAEDLADEHDTFRAGYPRLNIDEPGKALRAIQKAMADQVIPNLYRRGGAVTWIKTDDGDAAIGPVGPSELRSYVAEYVDVWTSDGSDGPPKSTLPPADVCSAIISRKDHDLPQLESVVTTPVLRPDGTLLQTPGYDEETGLYYHPRHPNLPHIADAPDAATVARAKDFLLNKLLVDFPWEARSDLAQYIGLMATPIVRTMIPSATPLGAITARDQGSGKSLLLEIISSMFSHSDMQWVSSEEEQRKAITAQLTEAAEPVVGIDNVPNGAAIGSHVLATLFTKSTWRDRVLGATKTVTVPNDKLWLVTGNNLQVTDDQASRTVWVRIDPKMPNPSGRTGFIVEREVTGGRYLGDWLHGTETESGNGWRVLAALLTLVQAWAAAEFPTADIRHRGYTRWASHIGGLLDFHGIHGFLENMDEQMTATDETAETFGPFYAQWWEVFGPKPMLARELVEADAMTETYPVDDEGMRLNPKKLAAQLKALEGRYFGGLVARKTTGDTRRGIAKWRLEPAPDREPNATSSD
ncbi:hypothetical protein [Saccharopolyspora shandongensis]|uniref:hypothetical protein n=1 Tax=Saccharopolyspora shandongensis TaxID=418495 RepID=UPI0033F8A24C